jgi:tetratricopeptide (TPR) repeat protein
VAYIILSILAVIGKMDGFHTRSERKQLEATYNGILISPTAGWFAFVDVSGAVEDLKARVCLWDFAAHALRTEDSEFVGQLVLGFLYRTPSAFDSYNALMIVDRERVVHFLAVPDLRFESKYPFGVTSAVLSADGMRFLTSAEPSGVTLGDRSTNRSIRDFPGMGRCGFSPDSRYAVTERTSGTSGDTDASLVRIDVWDARDARYVAGLRGTVIENLYFAQDSRHVVTEHEDHEVRVWTTKDFASAFAIPSGENQIVTDISADGHWLLARSWDDAGPIRLYDLQSGRSFEPHDCRTARRSLTQGWAGLTAGRVFSSPFADPQQLPLFSNCGTRIITACGLCAFAEDIPEFQTVPALVAAYIPLRLENGKLQPASPSDMLRARADYTSLRKGPQAPDAVRCRLQLVEQQRSSGRLEQALESWMSEIPSKSSLDLATAGRSDEVAHRLSDDFLSRGGLYERRRRYASALSDYRTASKLAETDPGPLKALAWLLATCPDTTLRNSREAVESARKARTWMQADDWEWLALYAAACAANGNWMVAVTNQEKALRLLPEGRKGRWLANYQERLRLYQSGRCYERQEFLDFLGNDLVARWDFDEPPHADVLTASVDRAPVRLNWNVASVGTPRGHVLKFEGDYGYADCGPLRLPDPISAITVAAWGRWDDVQREGRSPTIVSWGLSWMLLRSPETGAIAFECGGLNVPANAPHSHVIGRTPLLNDGRWHHFTGVFDGAGLNVYVDGALDGSADAAGAIPFDAGGVWVGLGESTRKQWRGLVDDVRVYAVALSAEEIAGLYYRGKSRHDDLFYVDAGNTRTITLPTKAVRLRAGLATDTGKVLADQWRVSWTLSAGPRNVRFVPRNDIPDPCVIFSGPGVYELRCTVEKDRRKADDTVPVVVFPEDFGGLVAHYTFDEGDARDNSGQEIDAIVKGGARIVSDDQRGRVLRLSEEGDYVDCSADPRFDVNEVVTVAAWVKVALFDKNHQSIVTKGDSAWGLCRNHQSDRLRFACGGMEGLETWPGPIGTTRVNDQKWHHVVGVCDVVQMYLYVDGRQDSSVKVARPIRINDEPVYIGENAEQPGRCWNGWIDDVRIYNRALSAEEIARLYEDTK